MKNDVEAEALKPLPDIMCLVESAKKLELIGADVFDEYSEEILREQYNGVGPDRFPAYIRYILSNLLRDDLEAVAIHDMKYYKGGTLEEFHAVNQQLKDNTRIIARKKFAWWQWRRWKLYLVANVLKDATDKYGLPGWRLAE